MNSKTIATTLLALVSGLSVLIYFDEGTLFLATLFLSILAIKTINEKINKDETFDSSGVVINSFVGLWFALSIAPALGITFKEVLHLENGFLIQALLSFLFFIFFMLTKISVIGRMEKKIKGGVGVVASALIAGAAAGISSSALWQVYVQLQAAL